MFCYECIYWDKKEGKCILKNDKCLADKVPDNNLGEEKDDKNMD